MEVQSIYKCRKFKQNDNLNLTCDNQKRCIIYYDEVCREYEEKEDGIIKNNNSFIDNIDNNSI